MATESEKGKRVDLGLAALLSGDPDASEPPVGDASAFPSQPLLQNDLLTGPVEPLSEFQQLARESRWQELVRSAETALAGGEDNPEARLWWVRGHLESFTMPVSFLAAPLAGVCHSLANADRSSHSSSLHSELRRTGKMVMRRLFEIGDRDHMSSLQRALESAGAYEQEKFSKRPSFVTAPTETLVSASQIEPARTFPPPQAPSESISDRKGRGPMVALALMAAFGAGGIFMFAVSKPYLSSDVAIAEEGFLQEPLALNLVMPALERRDPVGSLSALYYSIDGAEPSVQPVALNPESPRGELASGTGQPPPQIEQPREAVQPQPVKASMPKGSDATDRTAARKAREKVNTHGPVEGPEFTQRVSGRGSSSGSRGSDRTRERDRDRDRDVMASRDGNGVPPRLVMEERQQGSASSGVYRVIVATGVLSEPTYSGRVIGRLDAGDRVLVEARLGRWLKLRSRRGRGGFIMADDVSRREDPVRSSASEARDRELR